MPKKTPTTPANDLSRGLGPAQPRQEAIDEAMSAAWPDDGEPSSSEDRIRDLAYSYWLAEGKPEGRDAAHWARAADEVAQRDRETRAGDSRTTSLKPTTSIEAEDDATASQPGRPAGAAKAEKSAKSPGQATGTFGQAK